METRTILFKAYQYPMFQPSDGWWRTTVIGLGLRVQIEHIGVPNSEVRKWCRRFLWHTWIMAITGSIRFAPKPFNPPAQWNVTKLPDCGCERRSKAFKAWWNKWFGWTTWTFK